ncbi:MAG: hypothetical protein AAF675_12475 [Pseudomonadota bacterium]
MSDLTIGRGGGSVGHLDDLEAVEADAIVAMRLWCSGPACQSALWNAVAGQYGSKDGAARLRVFEDFLATLMTHARRPLMRHSVTCPCLGADESALAQLVGAAVSGDREEAVMMAALIARPDMATILADQAQQVGLMLRALSLRDAQGPHQSAPEVTHMASRILH